ECQVAHRRLAGVDELGGDLRPARRARDHVVLADRIALVAEAQFAFALDDQEYLLFAMVAVERALHLAGRQDREVVAELAGADVAADPAPARGVRTVLLDVVESDLVEIHDRLRHGAPPLSCRLRASRPLAGLMTSSCFSHSQDPEEKSAPHHADRSCQSIHVGARAARPYKRNRKSGLRLLHRVATA